MIQKMPENTRQKAIEQEGRLVLAINIIKKQQITKICEAAYCYALGSLVAKVLARR